MYTFKSISFNRDWRFIIIFLGLRNGGSFLFLLVFALLFHVFL